MSLLLPGPLSYSRYGAGVTAVASLTYRGFSGFHGHVRKRRLWCWKCAVGQLGTRWGQGRRAAWSRVVPPLGEDVPRKKPRREPQPAGHDGRPHSPAEGAGHPQKYPWVLLSWDRRVWGSAERTAAPSGPHCERLPRRPVIC